MKHEYRVLFVEDSLSIREKVRDLLCAGAPARFEVIEAETLAEGLRLLAQGGVDAVLLDLGLPDSGGLDTLRAMHRSSPDTAVIVLTADDREETVMSAQSEGAQEYLLKEEISGPLLQRTLRYAIENKRLEAELRHRADTDSLTGLHSRPRLLASLEKALDEAGRNETELTLCLLDVDNLKGVNDEFGHREGDRALEAVGRLIARAVEPPCFAGRYGGDEMLAVFPGMGAAGAAEVAEELRRSIESEEFAVAGRGSYRVSCTIGIAARGPGASTVQEIVIAADAALYDGKKQGRNRVVVSNRS